MADALDKERQEYLAARYEDFRRGSDPLVKNVHPYLRTPGLAYWNMLNAEKAGLRRDGINPFDIKSMEPVARLTHKADTRPAIYNGSDPNWTAMPSSRAWINNQRRQLYSRAGYRRDPNGKSYIKPGAMIPGEREYLEKRSLHNALASSDLSSAAAYKMGRMTPNEYMAYQNRWNEYYAPNPAGHSSLAADNARDQAITNYALLGYGLNTGLDFAAGDVPLALVGKLYNYGRVANKVRRAIKAGNPGTAGKSVKRRLNAYNRFQQRPVKTTLKGRVRGALYEGGIGAGLVGYQTAATSNQQIARGIEAAKTVPTHMQDTVFQIPIIGYEHDKTTGKPRPVRANYSDYYQQLRMNYGPAFANQFRNYHRAKSGLSPVPLNQR